MSSSTNEDREQSETTNMEESNLNTIEFLRARLLSERSVSKTARQRADELAERVLELEEQLNLVSLQRKKAEKATADVLAILKNHGISDVSEEFDSCSEQGDSPEDYTAQNGSLMAKETSAHVKLRENEKQAYSSSEVESSPSTGRSLSWRNTKDSQCSLEKKKYMDLSRGRNSFSSNCSSARRVGKSCRKIRRRETRSMDGLHNDGTENAAYHIDASNCLDGEPVANGKIPPESPTLGPTGSKKINGHYLSVHEKDEDMESALQHQEQLIGQFAEEEKAQREWEEKFRENNGGPQDSCDPGNYSDITEERYETKSPELPRAVQTIDSNSLGTTQETADTRRISGSPQTPKSLPSIINTEKGHPQNEKSNRGVNVHESSASEFSFPMSERSDHMSTLSTGPHTPTNISSSYVGKSTPVSASSRRSSMSELAVVPQETSNGLGSVLEALQLAKFSLNQKLSSCPQAEGGTSSNSVNPSRAETNKVDSFQIPFATPGLFRLPTDYYFEATTSANPSFVNCRPEIATGGFLSKSFVESRSAFSGNPFLSVPHRPLNPEMRPGASPQRSLSLNDPRLSNAPLPSNRTNHLDPYRNPALPPVQDSYPFLPDVTPRLPLNEEGASRTFPISDRGLPPVMRLSSYDGRGDPNMYR